MARNDTDDSSPAETRRFDAALEIEDFEDVTLLLKNPIPPVHTSWWTRLRSFFTFGKRPSWRQGFRPLDTNDDTPVRRHGLPIDHDLILHASRLVLQESGVPKRRQDSSLGISIAT